MHVSTLKGALLSAWQHKQHLAGWQQQQQPVQSTHHAHQPQQVRHASSGHLPTQLSSQHMSLQRQWIPQVSHNNYSQQQQHSIGALGGAPSSSTIRVRRHIDTREP